jgi:hypothetical protein
VDERFARAAGVADDHRTTACGRLDEDVPSPARRVRHGIAKTFPTA